MAQPIIDLAVLDGLETFFHTFSETVSRAMSMSINGVVRGKGLALVRRNMMDQVDFSRSYLTGDRLSVGRYANPNNLEATIKARDRATSLARFASGSPSSTARSGVRVKVKKGRTVMIKRGWLVRLKAGASLTEDNYNIGLAVRLGPGEKTVANKKTQHGSWLVKGSVALLYGPSVAQVFDDIRNEVANPMANMIEAEFLRQLARLA